MLLTNNLPSSLPHPTLTTDCCKIHQVEDCEGKAVNSVILVSALSLFFSSRCHDNVCMSIQHTHVLSFLLEVCLRYVLYVL